MGVNIYQRPCKTDSASFYKNLTQPVNKVPIVDLVFKYGLALNPPDNDVVQCSGLTAFPILRPLQATTQSCHPP